MEVARGSLRSAWRSKLPSATNALLPRPLPISSPTFRVCFSTSTPRSRLNRNAIPLECRNFMYPNGLLLTDRVNAGFLAQYDITHDRGVFDTFKTSTFANANIFKQFVIQMVLTPQHVIDVRDLELLDPRGHPHAARMRDRYAWKAMNAPLWLQIATVGGTKAIVRITLLRRLQSSIYAALEAKGYDRYGNGRGRKNLKGTVALIMRNPTKTVLLSKENFQKFGRAVVEELEAQQRIREGGPPPVQSTHDTRTHRINNAQRQRSQQRAGSSSPFL